MQRLLLVALLALAMLAAFAVPALAGTPANDGMGKMYAGHIRTEAQGGMLGADIHPGMHMGMRGWTMPME